MEGDCDDCGQHDAEADKDWMFQDSFLLLVFKNDLRATEECETVCFTDFLRIGHITHELFPEAPVFGIVSGTSVLLLLCRFLFRCRPTFLGGESFSASLVCFDHTVDLSGTGDNRFPVTYQMSGYGFTPQSSDIPASVSRQSRQQFELV